MLSKRLEIAMKEAGISQAELARACGVKSPSVHGWLNGKSKFLRGENLLAAAKALKVSQTWLATGKGAMHANNAGDTTTTDNSYRPALEIPAFSSVYPSIGSAAEESDREFIVDVLRLSHKWVLDNIRPLTKQENLCFISTEADEMAPTINPGDIVLVDIGVRTIRASGVYLFVSAEQNLFIKRVSFQMDGISIITSDNPTLKMVEELHKMPQISVMGRILWVWSGKKL